MRLRCGFQLCSPTEFLFCDNETNAHRLFGEAPSGYPKDAINAYIVEGSHGTVNPVREGTKCAALTLLTIAPRSGGGVVFSYGAGRVGLLDNCRMRGRVRNANCGGKCFLRSLTEGHTGCRCARGCSGRLSPACCGPSSTTILMSEAMVEGRSCTTRSAAGAYARTRQRLAAFEQCRYRLDAGQVGISMVCSLGSRFSLCHICIDRSELCEGPADPAHSASGICIRTGSSPPMSGRLATSIRRCMRGPPGVSTKWIARLPENRTLLS